MTEDKIAVALQLINDRLRRIELATCKHEWQPIIPDGAEKVDGLYIFRGDKPPVLRYKCQKCWEEK